MQSISGEANLSLPGFTVTAKQCNYLNNFFAERKHLLGQKWESNAAPTFF